MSEINNKILPSTIIEERSMGNTATEMSVFSRLQMERILFLSGEVTQDSMDTLIAQILFLDGINNRPIHLYIDSGGGDCYSGLALISVMNFVKSPIYTYVLGMAASMAAVIASNGEKGHRMALKYSRFMIHQPSSGLNISTFKDTEIHYKEMASVKQDLYEILAKNSERPIDEIEKLCDRDYWMKPEEAISFGFLDGVIGENN